MADPRAPNSASVPEPESPLAGEETPRAFGPDLVLAERRVASIRQLAAWPDRLGDAAAIAAAAAGVDAAPGPLRAAEGAGGRLLRVEPLKWLLVVARAEGAPDAPVPDPPDLGDAGVGLDLSHAWAAIRLDGARAPDLTARAMPLDLRARAFPGGSVATSAIHGVAVTVDARGGGFDLYCPRSFALSVWQHLCAIAAQFAVET